MLVRSLTYLTTSDTRQSWTQKKIQENKQIIEGLSVLAEWSTSITMI